MYATIVATEFIKTDFLQSQFVGISMGIAWDSLKKTYWTEANSHTSLTPCYKVPIDDSGLHRSQKLKEEYPAWKAFILRTH